MTFLWTRKDHAFCLLNLCCDSDSTALLLFPLSKLAFPYSACILLHSLQQNNTVHLKKQYFYKKFIFAELSDFIRIDFEQFF